jgi:Na+-driven multidrug efflux pump
MPPPAPATLPVSASPPRHRLAHQNGDGAGAGGGDRGDRGDRGEHDHEAKPFFEDNPLEMVGLDPDELLQWAREAEAEAAREGVGGGGAGGGGSGGAAADVERGARRRPAPGFAYHAAGSPRGAAPPAGSTPFAAPSSSHPHPAPSSKQPSLSSALRDPAAAARALVRGLVGATSTGPRTSSSSSSPHPAAAARRAPSLLGFTRLDAAVLKNVAAAAGAAGADPLMSVIDSYYIGKLGVKELAAMGPNSALFSVLYFLLFTSLAVLCTQSMAAARARGDAAGVGRGFLQAMAAAWLLSLPVALLLALFPDAALGFFHAAPETMRDARSYCVLRALALPAALTMVVCQAAFRSLLDLRTPLIVVAAATAANLLLDQLLMFGPLARWGVAGCGLATLGSQYVGALLFALCVWRRRRAFGLGAALREAGGAAGGAGGRDEAPPPPPGGGAGATATAPHKTPNNAPATATTTTTANFPKQLVTLLAHLEWRPFATRLAALSARGLLILSTYTSAALVAARHGTAAIAGHQVVQQQQQLQLSVSWSFMHVGQAMVAAALHAPRSSGGGKLAARRVSGAVVKWGVAWSVGAAASTFACRRALPALFARDAALLALLSPALLPAALMLSLAFNAALEGVLLGADDASYVVRSYPWAVGCCLAALWGGDARLRRQHPQAAFASSVGGRGGGGSGFGFADMATAAALEGGLLLLDGAAHVAALPLLPRATELLRRHREGLEARVASLGLRGVWAALAVYYLALLAAFGHRYWVRRRRI